MQIGQQQPRGAVRNKVYRPDKEADPGADSRKRFALFVRVLDEADVQQSFKLGLKITLAHADKKIRTAPGRMEGCRP